MLEFFQRASSSRRFVWALNVDVPPTIMVNVTVRSKNPVGPEDLILHLIEKISAQGANFKVLEFHALTIADRVSA